MLFSKNEFICVYVTLLRTKGMNKHSKKFYLGLAQQAQPKVSDSLQTVATEYIP
jgi:hypothetical protein